MPEVADDLVAEFLEAQKRPVHGCGICDLLPLMTDDQRTRLDAAMRHPVVNSAGIRGVLRDWGFTLDRKNPAKVVQNHRANHVGR